MADGKKKTDVHALDSRRLFVNDAPGSPHGGPSHSNPLGGRSHKHYRPRTLTETPQGKKVLSSDARLHGEKLKAKRFAAKSRGRNNLETLEAELKALEKERMLLELKLKHKREIAKLKGELERSKKRVSNEEGLREDGSSKRREVDLVELRRDIAMCKYFMMRTHCGLEVPNESPLSEDIENAKIDRRLKIPSFEEFDGTTNPLDFINVIDGRMSFFGHSDMVKCRFFCICLKGTALQWFNNLPPRSIESWHMLKNKFRTRFSFLS